MSTALRELRSQLSDIETDLVFVELAARLRPRLGGIMNWKIGGDAIELAQRFMAVRDARVEGILSPLLVRLLAAVERFMRGLIAELIAKRAAAAVRYEQLATDLQHRNIALTGTLLAAIESPRDYPPVQIDSLVANLASCKLGNEQYRLNTEAFVAVVSGVAPGTLEKALENVGVRDWWDRIGSDENFANMLGTTGARATGKRARERLRELWRWRNQLAHGGHDEIALSELQLRECIDFVRVFTARLDTVAFGRQR